MDQPSTHVVTRVAAILRAIGSQSEGMSTSDIARRVGIARPTVHRLLTSLAGEGLLDRDSRTARWSVGPELYLLGVSAATRYDVTRSAEDLVRRLADETGESAFVSSRRGDETVCLLREDGSFPIRSHVLFEGIRFPLGVASAGMAILAYLPDQEVDDYLGRADLTTAHGPAHSESEVRSRVGATRAAGWALNPGLLVEGSWGMGAAVFDAAERPRWALSLTGIEQRFRPDRRSELGALLLREAHRL